MRWRGTSPRRARRSGAAAQARIICYKARSLGSRRRARWGLAFRHGAGFQPVPRAAARYEPLESRRYLPQPLQQPPLARHALATLARETLDAFENRVLVQVRFGDHVRF